VRVIDSHCHLDDRQFDEDREAAIARARAAGVETMLAIGTGDGPPDLEAAVRLAASHECIYATVGVHPHDAAKATEETFARLDALTNHPKVRAVGEIGLDYHYDFSPRDVQHAIFERQLALATAASLPVVIHTREAWEDTISILRAGWRGGGIMHCFTGDAAQAREALDLGFSLAFGGVITFPKANTVREAARITPAEKLLVETDSPYLAPVPMRGKRNEPAFIIQTVRRLAAVRGCDAEEIAAVTSANFERLCLRPPLPNR
jgi:TatD DNase family protein